jgi:hypothetical protein
MKTGLDSFHIHHELFTIRAKSAEIVREVAGWDTTTSKDAEKHPLLVRQVISE